MSKDDGVDLCSKTFKSGYKTTNLEKTSFCSCEIKKCAPSVGRESDEKPQAS